MPFPVVKHPAAGPWVIGNTPVLRLGRHDAGASRDSRGGTAPAGEGEASRDTDRRPIRLCE